MASNLEDFLVKITKDSRLDISEGVAFVQSNKCGAINTFSGCIRDTDTPANGLGPEPLDAIEYDGYETMILKYVSDLILREIQIRQGSHELSVMDTNTRVYVNIRLGKVLAGEVAIVICVSSTGRDISHRATMNLLLGIKSSAPIWKKLIFANGHTEWVENF